MKIVIDARLWKESGIGRYIRNLIDQLQKIDQANIYFILLRQPEFNTVNFSSNFHKTLADFEWYGVKEQLQLPKIISKIKPDLVHFPHFNVPIFYQGKYVITIHDLIHQHFQTRQASTHSFLLYGIKKIGYKKVFQQAVKKSIKIITPSQFVKNQLITECNISDKKITVTPEAVEESLIKISQKSSSKNFENLSQKFHFNKPYLFYVGNAQPHKNINKLISAFKNIKDSFPELSLVLSGPDHFFWQEIKLQHPDSKIIFTGFITEEELVSLYNNAKVFVMPSLEEGFGIPILEAMACGCPVVTSKAGSLPEVAGEAAVYFDPTKIDDIVEKVSLVLSDDQLLKRLKEKGLKRYQEFNWKKLAIQTLNIYQQALN